MSRDFHLPGRSPVIACDGMAATSHPLASLAAIDALRDGGNAADAAVTAAAVLSVVEPHMTGIGGDCFCMIAKPGSPVWGYNGSGRAGQRASLEALLDRASTRSPLDSIHAVTVPGAVDAWAAILARMAASGLIARLHPPSATPRKAFPSHRALPGTGRSWWQSCAPTPAPPAIICSAAVRPRKATSSSFPRSPKRCARSQRKVRALSMKARLRRTWWRRLPSAVRFSPWKILREHRGEVGGADHEQLSRPRYS